MTMITVVNKSKRVSDGDVQLMTRAVAAQTRYHFCPAYGLSPVPVVYAADESTAPEGSFVIGVFDTDDSGEQDALGWHTESADGVVFGRVFAGPVLDNGGDALTKALSVASVLSHEVLETIGDVHANGWADDGNGTLYAQEVCDPVESDSYTVQVRTRGRVVDVTVSNFILPAWYDPQAPAGTKTDYLGKLRGPFAMTRGGYVVKMRAGKVSQTFGDRFPAWRRGVKARPLSDRRAAVDGGGAVGASDTVS